MTVDPAAVLDRYVGRVSDRSMSMLRSAEEAGEYAVMVEELLATLSVNKIPVSDDEAAELEYLVGVTGEGSEYLGKLTRQPS